MIKLKLSDVGKFLASSAVIYSAAFADVLCLDILNNAAFYQKDVPLKHALCHALCLNHHKLWSQSPIRLSITKEKLVNQAFLTVGAYKLVDSVFEFKSVHTEACVSTLAGAAAGVLNLFVSSDFHMRLDELCSSRCLVYISTKALAAGALAYINHDYSADPVELNDAIDNPFLN